MRVVRLPRHLPRGERCGDPAGGRAVKLTGDQKRAVERTGQDVCVVAGPGSGKTRVLTERFAWLVENAGVEAGRILAVTFTEKAATEIKQRLLLRFVDRPDLREGIERAWVSTIHGFCARLLREHAIAAGLAPDFSVLDQAPSDRMARAAAEEAIDELLRQRPEETRRLLESLDLSTQDDGRQPDLARSLLDVYEAMRLAGLRELPPSASAADALAEARELARTILNDTVRGNTPGQKSGHAELREWARAFLELPAGVTDFELARLTVSRAKLVRGSAADQAAAKLKDPVLERVEAHWLGLRNAPMLALLRDAIARLAERYREKKREQSALDFADLEEETIRLLESDESIRRETAERFDEILLDELQDTNRLQWRLIKLIRRRLFAVGDINQSIYGFRHADPAVFREYRSTLAQVDELRENHRSSSQILHVVSQMLDGQDGIEPRGLTAARGPGAAVERIVGRGEKTEDAEEVEAALVAARIRELADSNAHKYSDIAVLVRALSAIGPFERALDRFDIPFLVSGGRTFLEAREIRDLTALLAALVNPLDDVALIGVLRSPLAGIADEELFRAGREAWRETFDRLFGGLRKMADFAAPDRLMASALDQCGYVADLPERARANVEKFLSWLRREHAARPRPLAEMLEDVEALRVQQSEAEAPPPDAANVVRVMSIHAAKGLEFPVVFVSALHRRPDSRKPVIAFSNAAGLGAKWRHPITGKGQSDAAHMRVVEELKQTEREEENRLLYVAMTRAEDRLILSHAATRRPYAWQEMAEAVVPATIQADSLPEPAPIPITETSRPAEQLYAPPPLTGQYDSTAAVTAVAAFHACPRKYFLSTIAEGESFRGEGGIATGLAAHRILAGETIDSVEGAALARVFRESGLGLRAQQASRIEREFDFLLHIEDVVLRGQIDLWFEESGELILVDYKTDREESTAGQYAVQLRLYALALRRYAGRVPDRAVLYYLRSNRAIEVGISEPELAEAEAVVAAFRDAQESLEFPLRAGEQCRRCEFFGNRCPATL
jgi:ATP-dependent exoDNAse (exonuclease V) beta subunit